MAYNNLNDWATSICDAIREKEGSSDLIPAPDIPERIRGIIVDLYYKRLYKPIHPVTFTITPLEANYTMYVMLAGAGNGSELQFKSKNGSIEDRKGDANFTVTYSDGTFTINHKEYIICFIVCTCDCDTNIE